MNCQEFATLSQYDIDVKVIVLHNDTLGMIVQLQDFFYNQHYSQCRLNKKRICLCSPNRWGSRVPH